jgi:hypothetical protein
MAEIVVASRHLHLPDDEVADFFAPFARIGELKPRLRLAIARRNAEEAGGRVACSHDVHAGFQLHIWLPLAAASSS